MFRKKNYIKLINLFHEDELYIHVTLISSVNLEPSEMTLSVKIK